MTEILTDLTFHLRVAGAGLILLAIAHFAIAKHLKWKEDFSKVTLANRQIFYVHCIFLMFVLVMMGLLSLVYTEDLIQKSNLARTVLIGFTAFWTMRLIFQWVVYDKQLWQGNRLNTVMHFVFTGVWLYLTVVYATAAWRQF